MQKADIVSDQVAQPNDARRIALIVLVGWLTMLGFDFFLHGGLLAGLYVQDSPFLLRPAQAFALIPLGYLSFLLLSSALTWLMVRMGVHDGREGAVFGLKLGHWCGGRLYSALRPSRRQDLIYWPGGLWGR
jgi:hypothetical protein